jgi:hypothetical protein
MKNFNISNYALMLENNAFVVEATPQEVSKQITKQVAKSLIKPDEKDSDAVKAIKSIISDPTKNKTQYDSIISQIEPFIFNQSETVKSTELNFKSADGKTSYMVVVNREKDPNGNYAVWFDEDGTKVFLAGLDINYLATQFNKAIDYGMIAGTDEESFASVVGAIHKESAAAGADPKQVFKAVADRYKTAFGEDFYEAVDGEFTGSPDVFARALVGVEIKESDISTALGVDFLQSLAIDVAFGIATFGAGAAVKGLMTGARAVRAASAVNKIKGGMTAFKSGLAGQKTGVGISGAANVATLSKGAKDVNLAKSGFSAITAAGNTARTGGVIGAGVGAGSTIAGATGSADQVESNITADDAAFAFASQLRELAKGYTDGGAELQIAFMILSLNAQSAPLVLAQWNKNFGDEGTFYDYCISEELDGDLKALIDGYWAAIANEGPLVQKVATISGNMKTGTASTEEAPTTE